jgi:hypothetical protein
MNSAPFEYKTLMYALHSDFRTWVCAIDATKKGVCLRFLYGVVLDDKRVFFAPARAQDVGLRS